MKSGNHGYSLNTSEKVETLGDDMPRNSVNRETLQESNIFVAFHHISFQPRFGGSEIPRLRSGTPCRGIATIAFFGHVADGNSPISGSVVKLSEIAAKTSGNDLVSPFQTLEVWQSVNFQAKQAGVAVPNFSCRQEGWLANQVWDDADILPALIHVEMVRAALVLVCVCVSLQPSTSMNCW